MTLRPVVSQNQALLRQGLALIDGLADDLYAGEDLGSASGLGAHMRHVIEFYRALLDGLPIGRVDYDGRPRDRAIERRRSAAVRTIEDLIAELDALEADPDQELRVRVDAPGDGEVTWSRSSVLRELQFAVSHTVHHYALIAGQIRERGGDPGSEFGVAPSTLAARDAGVG